MKTMLQKLMFACLFLTTSMLLSAADLPLSGGYYRIKNYNSDTYIGGTGTGAGTVIHVAADTDPNHQVFLVTVNGDNNYVTFKQKESGLFITHDNSYTGSYAAVTGNNRQNFIIDNATTDRFCIIKRIKDDNSVAFGIGYDSADPGSKLYMDKDTTKMNKWIFEPVIELMVADLQSLITRATDLYAGALDAEIAAASAFLTSSSAADILGAIQTLKAEMRNYEVQQILTAAQNATLAEPVEVTDLLVNPDFETNGLEGWTNNGMQYQNNDWPKKTGDGFAEKWVSSGSKLGNLSLSQTLKMQVPNGKYILTATAQALQQGNEGGVAVTPTGAELFAGNFQVAVGDSTLYTVSDILVVNGSLTVGFRVTNATANWAAVDNFQLYYCGVDLTALSDALSALLATATAINETMQTSVRTELDEAISEANVALSAPVENTLNAASVRLAAAIEAANASVAVYASLNVLIGTVQDTVATYTGTEDKTAINTVIALAQGIYDAHTVDAEEIETAKEELIAALLNFQMDNADDNRPAQVTSFIVNPGFDGNSATGWTPDGSTGACNYSEYELYNKSTFDFHQVITGLRKGLYKVTVQGFYRPTSNSHAAVIAHEAGTEVIPVALYANNKTSKMNSVYSWTGSIDGWRNDSTGIIYVNNMEQVRLAFDAGQYLNAVTAYVGNDGSLRLGIKTTGATQSSNWTIFDNFNLYYLGESALQVLIDDLTAAYENAALFFDAIDLNDVSEEGNNVIGKYKYSDYTSLENAIYMADDLLFIFNNGEPVEENDIASITEQLNVALAAMTFYIPKNELPNGDYFITVAGTYYLNDAGVELIPDASPFYAPTIDNQGLASERIIEDGRQIWTVAKVSGLDRATPVERYSFFNVKSGRHLNENPNFRNDWGSSDNNWRTQNIYRNEAGLHGIQPDGNSASKGMWKFDGTQVIHSGITTVDLSADSLFTFNFLSVATVFPEEVAAGRALFNAAVNGNEIGQYANEVYADFKTALETAEGISAPTTADLLAYGAARKLFVPITSSLDRLASDKIKVWAGDNFVQIESPDPIKVAIFTLTGIRVAETVVNGVETIALSEGLYVVKVAEQVTKVIVR